MLTFCWLQRLHRIITSEELVSPHHSAREMIEVVRNRDFAKLFQKSVRKVGGITTKLCEIVLLNVSAYVHFHIAVNGCIMVLLLVTVDH